MGKGKRFQAFVKNTQLFSTKDFRALFHTSFCVVSVGPHPREGDLLTLTLYLKQENLKFDLSPLKGWGGSVTGRTYQMGRVLVTFPLES